MRIGKETAHYSDDEIHKNAHLMFGEMWYIWYSQATLCKNLPDEEIQQQISSEYPVKPILMDLLSLYCQSRQISPQPKGTQNLTIKKITLTLPSDK